MKPKNIVNALNDIDFDMIEEAEQAKMKSAKTSWMKWGSIAACFALMLTAGALLIPHLNSPSGVIDDNPNNSEIRLEDRYKNISISAGESMIEWPWEYKTLSEKYMQIVFDGTEYRTRAKSIREELLGEVLGTCLANGYDTYTDKSYTEEFEVRAVKGVDSNHIVAVNMDGEFIVFLLNDFSFPATLGEFINTYSLSDTLSFGRYSEKEGSNNKGYYLVNDDAYIWQILSECSDAPWVDDSIWSRSDKHYISFTATSEALGIYKKAFYISEDGYVWTNIMEYASLFEIGVKAAGEILDYVKTHSTETDVEPYTNSIAGTVVEIGDGYILIDDSVLCINPEDGIVFKVLADDLRISRYIDSPYRSIQVGDIVKVEYTGIIDVENEYEVTGAFAVNKGILIDGEMLIPE